MAWSTFIKIHLGEIVAADFFTVELLKPFGLVRYYVFFVIDIQTRRVQIAGIVHQPYGEWMKQIARNLTDAFDGFILGKRYFIHDRDPLFTDAFRRIIRDFGVKPLKLPARSPNLNSYAERFILSIRSECLNKIILFSESQLRRVVKSYVELYHLERSHQGLDNELIEKSKNQYSSNIICLTNALPKKGKAMDKAITKHGIKHGEKNKEYNKTSNIELNNSRTTPTIDKVI